MFKHRSRVVLRLAALLGLVSVFGPAHAAQTGADTARQALLARVDSVRAQLTAQAESQAQSPDAPAGDTPSVAQWLNWPNWNNWNNWPNWGNWNNWVNWFNR